MAVCRRPVPGEKNVSEKAAAAPVGAVSGTLLAAGGMVVSGPGIAQVGIVGAAFSLVACALVALTLWLARREGIRG